jgi:hypothetical protein
LSVHQNRFPSISFGTQASDHLKQKGAIARAEFDQGLSVLDGVLMFQKARH